MSTNIEGSLLSALVSGTSTAAVVGTLTYPLDFIKHSTQLNHPQQIAKYKIPSNGPHSMAQLFKGCSALVTGNILKNGARIFSYHWASNFMSLESQDSHGNSIKKTTAPRIVIAGFMSGMLETLWLIPFENIKIAMIQNQLLRNEIDSCLKQGLKIDVTGQSIDMHHKPTQNIFKNHYISPHIYFTNELAAQYKGLNVSRFSTTHMKHTKKDALKQKYNKNPSLTLSGVIKEIYTLKGTKGFAYGGFITFIRQGAISSIWLSTYNWTKQLYLPHNKSHDGWFGESLTLIQSVGLQVAASAAVITITQPIDVVKSHMQSKNSHVIYKDSLGTAYRLVMEQGFTSLYKGTLPRGIKVLVSGGLSANLYAYFESMFNNASSKTVFSNE
ncbi:hypothetical protein CLIB1444_05S04962 [[Candida] jaroonii]|uniref:Uncharacterized protein n=1 Tax=[Candida] jaroonii TaxID=467808 RepID=A0ACA9Y812_9ASCO|nr:hypothetical protein CLIB1444_05S04962 [[Candida] jaroonii]